VTHSPLASPSATRAVLESHGRWTNKSLGQHFLVDDNVVGRIIELAALSGTETVLEIGPGIGTLTLALCASARAVVAVERDAGLVPVLADTTAECPRFALISADATTVTAEELGAPFGPPTALVANLPYNLAATLVLHVFQTMPSISSATVMVQSEVGGRMSASPGTKEYGAYTVKLRLLARPTGRFPVARGCFFPPPRVDSTVLRLEREPLSGDPRALLDATRAAEAAFAQRRKTIRNSLRARIDAPVEFIDAALASAGVPPDVRAETLSPETFIVLGAALRECGAFGT